MKTLQLAIALIAITFYTSSCVLDGGGLICTKGSGEIITETYDLESFDRIDLQMGADVVLTQGDAYSVEVEASDNLHKIITTNVKSGELVLRLQRNDCIRGKSDVVFYVSCPDIKTISVSGSGNITNATPIEAGNMDMNVSGSGNIDFNDFNANDCIISVSGSGNINLSGDRDMNSLEAKISGSGEINAFNAPANRVDIRVSGSGDCEVTANETLDVHISGSGSVHYKGQPSITQKITGSGSISNRN